MSPTQLLRAAFPAMTAWRPSFGIPCLVALIACSSASFGATAPGAPTIGVAVAGNGQAIVAFAAPASNGGSVITKYTVTSTPDSFTANAAISPIVVKGLSNGTTYTFTVTATNAIGTGPASTASKPVTPRGIAVSAGGRHAMALGVNGAVRAWGEDGFGQLGTGRVLQSPVPIASPGISAVKAISSGTGRTVALKTDGTVWAWGDNSAGQLGDGTKTDRSSAVQVAGLTGIVAVAAGNCARSPRHTCF